VELYSNISKQRDVGRISVSGRVHVLYLDFAFILNLWLYWCSLLPSMTLSGLVLFDLQAPNCFENTAIDLEMELDDNEHFDDIRKVVKAAKSGVANAAAAAAGDLLRKS